MKLKKLEILALVLMIVVQSLVFLPFILNKNYIHIEEAKSLGHASGDVAEIQDRADFYDTWHNGAYYESYLALNDGEDVNAIDVYKNQINDVNPPLYYMMLNAAMNISRGSYSVWPGAIINIIAYAIITVFLYLIAKRLFAGENYAALKSGAVTLLSALTLGALSSVIYTGMFSIVSMIVVIWSYIHIRMYEKKKVTAPILIGLGVIAFLGLVISYYCLLFIVPMYVLFLTRYIRAKEKKTVMAYSFTLLGALVAALAVFPFAAYNMFFGNLGGKIVGTLGIQSALLRSTIDYTQKINYFGFNNMLLVIAILALVCVFVKMRRPYVEKEETEALQDKKMIIKTLLIPSFAYFLGVIAVSQWTELRYIMPICGILFVLIMYGLYKFTFDAFGKKACAIIMAAVVVAMAVYPVISKSTPESTYADKEEVMEKISGEYNLPAVYLLHTSDNRFLDDILMFTKLNNSYIAENYDFREKGSDFDDIIEGQDTKDGILVFINNGQDNKYMLYSILNETDFDSFKVVAILNSGTIYHIGNGIEMEETLDLEYAETLTEEEILTDENGSVIETSVETEEVTE